MRLTFRRLGFEVEARRIRPTTGLTVELKGAVRVQYADVTGLEAADRAAVLADADVVVCGDRIIKDRYGWVPRMATAEDRRRARASLA